MIRNIIIWYFLLIKLLFSSELIADDSIETEAARLKEVSTTYLLDGVVEAEQKTTISAQTHGVVKEIRFDVNDYIEKDQVVVVIDNKQQVASLKQVRAVEKEAKARLQEAQSEFNRIQQVYREKVVSKSTFDKAQAGLKAAKARSESSQASTTQAREQLDYTLVRAPFSGILTQRLVEPGESVSVGSVLATGISLEQLRVTTHVPQSILKDVRQRRFAIVVTEDSEIVSKDMTFFPFADPFSHSFQLRIHLPAGKNNLSPGMFVKVAMEVSRENKTVVPFNAVAFRGEVTGVYVLEKESLHFRHVRLGRRLQNNEVVIVAGVHAGELIVTDPVAAAISIKTGPAE